MLLRSQELHPNKENASLDELKVAMDAAPNKRSYIRLNAIRSLLLGIPRSTICQQFCRTDRMVRLWIEMFNRGGIDALITRPKPGRPRKVKLERVRDLLVPGDPRSFDLYEVSTRVNSVRNNAGDLVEPLNPG